MHFPATTGLAAARHARREGFTLIELLTVIAIIGILAAIIIPTVGRVRTSARAAQCMSNLRQVALAQSVYAQDNGGRFTPLKIEQGSDVAWQNSLFPYVGQSARGSLDPRSDLSSVFNCPAAEPEQFTSTTFGSYGMNSALRHPNWNYQASRVPNPARVIMVGDMIPDENDYISTSDGQVVWSDYTKTNRKATTGVWTSGYDNTTVLDRHGSTDKAHYAFVDGHVAALGREQLLLRPAQGGSLWCWWEN